MEPVCCRADADKWMVLVQGITDHAIFLLDVSGRVLAWNTGAEAIFGYSADQMLGEHCGRLFTRADIDRDRPRQQLTDAAGGYVAEEGWRVTRDGRELRVHATVRSIRDDAGRLIGFANIVRPAEPNPTAGDRVALLAERERIAVELYTRTMRTFFGIGLQLNGVANRVNDPEIGQLLDECTRRLDDGISELRRLTFDLRHAPT